MAENQNLAEEKENHEGYIIPLSTMKPKQKGILRAIKAPQVLAHRLMSLSILPGTEIEVVRTAAFGDPMEISAKGFRLALRKKDAQFLLVEIQKEASNEK
ncbi:MAG: ferrous iron transport protein A [Armatimonadetes bacterium]|nr:ferrous iron transport protein A [Armatimonadota bacterium]MDW8027360.1 ferrous iron transport protein A [Armatimonadota bacterium]